MSTKSETHVKVKLEHIKNQAETVKCQYDFYKHMTTLNTGAFLIIVALMGGVFDKPKGILFIVLSLSLFSVSLISSLKEMDLFAGVLQKIWRWNFGLENQENIKKEVGSYEKKSNIYTGFSSFGFGLGMVSLLVFAMMNIF